MSYLLLGQKVKRCNVGFLLCVSVNIVILVLAVALFLLVLHHNFLGLSSLLRNEVSGMGTLTKALLPVKDLEFPVSHILSYITRFLLGPTEATNDSEKGRLRSVCSISVSPSPCWAVVC